MHTERHEREREREREDRGEKGKRERERETRSLLGELFYIHAINVSAQTHTHWSTESTCFLCRLRRARLFKKGNVQQARRGMSLTSTGWLGKTSLLFCYFVILFIFYFLFYFFSLVTHRGFLIGGGCFCPLSLSLSVSLYPNVFSALFMLRTAPVTQLDNRASMGHLFSVFFFFCFFFFLQARELESSFPATLHVVPCFFVFFFPRSWRVSLLNKELKLNDSSCQTKV